MGVVNILGSIYSIYVYTWLQPDLAANVRIGFHEFKVNMAIYFGTFVWGFLSMCVFAPWFTHRTNALVGNAGMAICSIVVIANHWLLENKWVWGGLLYIVNIMMYVLFLGMALMGQNSKYYYDRNRLFKLSIPVIANFTMTALCYGWIEDTGFADIVPWISFGVHTNLAILAQVCAPRTETWDFFEFLNKSKRS